MRLTTIAVHFRIDIAVAVIVLSGTMIILADGQDTYLYVQMKKQKLRKVVQLKRGSKWYPGSRA